MNETGFIRYIMFQLISLIISLPLNCPFEFYKLNVKKIFSNGYFKYIFEQFLLKFS